MLITLLNDVIMRTFHTLILQDTYLTPGEHTLTFKVPKLYLPKCGKLLNKLSSNLCKN